MDDNVKTKEQLIRELQEARARINDLERTLDAVKANEEKLKTICANLPIGISVLDNQRNVVLMNPALGEILSMTPEQLQQGDYKARTYIRADGTEMPTHEFASIQSAEQQRSIHNVETGIINENGNVIWTNVSAVPLDLNEWQTVVITTDITQRKEAQDEQKKLTQEISKRNKHLSCLYKISHLLDQQDVEFEQIVQDIVNLIPSACLSPENAFVKLRCDEHAFFSHGFKETALKQSIDIVVGGKSVGLLEVHLMEEDPSLSNKIYFDNEYNLFEAIAERLSRVIELRNSHRDLIDSQQRYKRLVENIPSILYEFSNKEGGVYYSPQVEKILGYSPEYLLTHPMLWHDSIHPDDLSKVDQSIDEFGKSSISIEYRIMDATGNWRWFHDFSIGNRNHDDEFIITGLAVDVTERKTLEEEARRAELLQSDLKKEKELSALKDRFMSIVSHEFRTPLGIIQTSSDLLMQYFERMTPERRKQALKQIQEQIVSLTGMIDGVLSIGQAKLGRIEFSPTLIELGSFCQLIFDQIQFSDTKQHHFVFSDNTSNQSAMVDGNLLKHILTNLLSNAVKYSPERNKITVELNLDDDSIVITVSDEGIGIPEKDQDRLFEPFHRASNVGTIEGTGLGLSIVKEYVELHQGTIEFESKESAGTTFIIRLPAQ